MNMMMTNNDLRLDKVYAQNLNNSGKKIVNNSNLSFNDFLLMQKNQNNSTKSVNPYNLSKNK
jgi:hypothetical protein